MSLDGATIKTKNTFIKALIDSLKTKSVFQIDMSLSEELDAYLDVASDLKDKARKIPYGNNGAEDLKKIGLLLSKTQSYKTRVREIDIGFLSFLKSLNSIRKRGEVHIRDSYRRDLSEMKPQASQNAVIDAALEDIDSLICDAEFIRAKAGIVLQNLTDTYFTLRETKQIAEAFLAPSVTQGYRNV